MTARAPAFVSIAFSVGTALGCTGPPGDRGSGRPMQQPFGDVDLQLASLVFAVVGDTRPPEVDDTPAYPSSVVEALYAGIAAADPRPAFVLATGDYLYASPWPGDAASQADPQLDLYLRARARFAGPLFPALGNHECTGATSSNCGPGAADGTSANYAAFMRKLLAPFGVARPYYAVALAAADGAWTAKVVVVAANAWSDDQAAWLDAAMARATTYTFVVRHEPASDGEAPGVAPSEAILAAHPYTLAIVGHRHTYAHAAGSREILIGNGGAPLDGKSYGFGLFSRGSDGAISVDMIDWRTGAPDPSFHFAVGPAGEAVP
jgi:calcineurin-like phosphoesterase family protein